MPEIIWDSKLYDQQHQFVSDYGADVLQLLAPQPINLPLRVEVLPPLH